MAWRALLLLTVLVVAACSGGGSTTTNAPSAAPSGAPASVGLTPTLGPSLAPSQPAGGVNLMSLRPSGAKLRIANLYRDASGKPTDLDIYGDFDARNAPKLVTVPYGTVTDFFDPGVQDDEGDANWTFYPAGKTSQDDQVGMQTETLKGTERITMVIGDGDNKSSTGTQLGMWKTIFETSTDFPLPTPPTASDAVLMVDGVGITKLPNTDETFVFVGVDGTCLPGVDQGTAGGGQPWGPHSQQNYIYPAGSHAVSAYLTNPDCSGKSPYPDTTVALNAGQRALLLYYTPDDQNLKALLIPVQ